MTEIFVLNCQKHRDFLLSQKDKVTARRREKVSRAIKESAALLSLGAEIILSYALSLPLPVEYEKRENGKPFLEGQKCFNISHSGDYVLCAVCDCEVGADIERIERMRENTFKRIFSPAEKECYEKEHKGSKDYLCRVWTRKESILKMTGEGLRHDLREICTEKDGFFIKSFDFNGYIISVCTEKESEIKINELSL